MTVDYRLCGPADAALFDRVADDVFDAAIAPARLARYLADPAHKMVVALHDGVVIGQCAGVVHLHPDQATELYIDNLGVAPAFRRQGVARGLVSRMLDLGRSLGCEEAWVGTETDNAAANGLYETFGAEGETFVLYKYEL